jgi:nucleotide-binding universal stress UspA family protein
MNVLLATDGSRSADGCLNQAINLVKHSGGRLTLTFFANPHDTAVFGGLVCHNSLEWQKYGQEILDKLAQEARNAGVEHIETVLEHYQGEERLAQLAQEVDANYIMLASHLFNFA